MSQNNHEKELYEAGEERFGRVFSRLYGISRGVPTLKKFYGFALDDILKHKFSNVLDIGSGTGYMLLSIAELTRNTSGLGIDPSPHMIRVASRNVVKQGKTDRVKFSAGSSRTIPGNSKFDLIYTTLSFHHWKSREDSVMHVVERLNPDGVFLIYEVSDDGSFNRRFVRSHLMSSDDFREMSGRIGLKPEILEKDGYIRAAFKPKNVG